jgi:predicted nucleotidyltransferase
MRPQILSLLAGIEAEHGIRILYACESGSRAWGFPSPDSDYDVRFVYAHPAEWYFRWKTSKTSSKARQ